MPTLYNMYCDESDTNGQNVFWIGALICSPARARILGEQIKDLRESHNYTSEFKWTKLKAHNYKIYADFISIFFNNDSVQLRLMPFTKNRLWRQWEKSNNARMAKCYYCFLDRITKSYFRYNIYGDQLFHDDGKSFDKINFILNMKRKYERGLKSRNLPNMREVNSSNCDMIQLVDVLMGAYKASSCKNENKRIFSNYVKTSLSGLPEKRFLVLPWTFHHRKSSVSNKTNLEGTP